MRRLGKIGVYGPKTRNLQRRLSFEAFGLTFKHAKVFRYLGDRNNENPDINDIATKVFYEVPDRAYDERYVEIPIGMEAIPESKTDFSRFGIINPLQDETIFRLHVDDMEPLGRDLIIGDVFEIPFHSDEESSSFWEVTDVDKRSAKEKFIIVVSAVPLGESRETREIDYDNGAEDMFNGIAAEAEEEFSDIVPVEGITFDEDIEPEEVDYRDDLQSDFLDDPNKTF